MPTITISITLADIEVSVLRTLLNVGLGIVPLIAAFWFTTEFLMEVELEPFISLGLAE